MSLAAFNKFVHTHRFRSGAVLPTALALALAVGWASREAAFAIEKADQAASQTITLDRVTMMEAHDPEDPTKRTGMIGFYLQGDTPASTNFVTGRFVIEPGKTPHKPHTHIEEEVMIVESGRGEIFCDGKTTKVGPGSVMFTVPNASHGITNTGDAPLAFTFVKWGSKSASVRAAK